MSQVTEQYIRFQTALASIKLIQASTVLDLKIGACRNSVRLSMGNYLATRSYGSLLDFHGWTKEKENIQDAFFNKRDMKAVAMATTDDIINAMTIYGTPSMAREQLERHWPSCD